MQYARFAESRCRGGLALCFRDRLFLRAEDDRRRRTAVLEPGGVHAGYRFTLDRDRFFFVHGVVGQPGRQLEGHSNLGFEWRSLHSVGPRPPAPFGWRRKSGEVEPIAIGQLKPAGIDFACPGTDHVCPR